MPISLAIPKFIGTVSLGLLTGISYTLTLTYPTLLLLPSATHASRTFSTLSRLAQLHLVTLGTLSLLAFQTAFFASPRRSRHPYLLWTSLLAFGSVAQDVYQLGKSVDVSELGVNGEMVEKRVRKAQGREVRRAVVGGVAFALGVIGLWGDGA
ncbi:hypothetical protein BDZ85DRAFT_244039 [Elsinoe ampelina]|uniref:DUF1772-domain-containing protein n=1 Tax=Elsinoe ampelina TaxID=302913 RepID=A0A6A6G001_9PEZI|nr:hypothetical protein BDZ85DRAFT_244039 [Elsinoe ampelina]